MPTNKSEYQVPYYKHWYQENKEAQKQTTSARRRKTVLENKKKIADYLRSHPCVDCGEADIIVLHFDHVRGKKRGNICTMVQSGCSWPTLLVEIKKCEVRCANDHMRKTAREQKSYKCGLQVLEAA